MPTPAPSVVPGALPAPATWSLDTWRQKFLAAWPSNASSSYFSNGTGSGDLYWAGYGIDTAITAYRAGLPGPSGQPSTYYIDWALSSAEHWTSIATVGGTPSVGGSTYKGWPSGGHSSVGSGLWGESLGELSGWRYVAKLLRVIKQDLALSSAYASRYAALLEFSEKHVFEKWNTFSGGGFQGLEYNGNDFLTPAMGAQLAFDLSLCSTDPARKAAENAAWASILTWMRDSGPANRVIVDGVLYAEYGHTSNYYPVYADLDHSGQFFGMFAEFIDQESAGNVSPQWSSYLPEVVAAVKTRWWSSSYSSWSVYPDGSGGSIETNGGTEGLVGALHVGDSIAQLGQFDATIQHQLETYMSRGSNMTGFLPSIVYAHGAFNFLRLTGAR